VQDAGQIIAARNGSESAAARESTMIPGSRRIVVRLRLISLVLLVLAATAAGFVLIGVDSSRDAWLVLGTGVALSAAAGAVALARVRQGPATPEVEQYIELAPEIVVLAGFDGYWKRVNPTGRDASRVHRARLACAALHGVRPSGRPGAQ
jgi:hypothetical protein